MEQQESRTKTLVDVVGKPFIQAEELTERIAAAIDGSAADYAIGFAAVFGALEQIKAQYLARVALKVSAQSPGDILAIDEAANGLRQMHAANAAAALEAAQKAPRTSIEKRIAAAKNPTKAPRPPVEKARAGGARVKLSSVKK
jgi:hypothetical protein